ncbi:acetyl esterase/lipase [Pseudorhodoplanes sinuspersici]|nr:acetyl esterase/lipase [Pseudorhodoplanes sinuspersici]
MLRLLRIVIAACITVSAICYVAFKFSPWPSAMLVRLPFDWEARKMAQALEKHVPKDVSAHLDIPYDASDDDATLDVFYPSRIEGSDITLPTIVWIHGGAWVSGNKNYVANYLRILAARGYTTVGVGYSLAPDATYPTPVRQANAALGYLTKNAKSLHIDSGTLFLAGDSAGAQIAAQLANIISVASYAADIGIMPTIQRSQLRGVLLYCGAYDIAKIDLDGRFSDFLRTVLWSYLGTKDFIHDPRSAQASVERHVTPAFPPTFITAGNDDPLRAQSREMAKAVASQGVYVDSLFYPDDHKPPLPHEYQFNLDNAAGQTALERSLQFLARQTQ